MYYSVLNTTRSAMAIFQWFLLCQKKKKMFWKDSRDFIKVSKWRIGHKKINN